MVKGLGTVIYHVPDLSRAKAWYVSAFQQPPYFDQPFYVGFNIAGYELGLDPNASRAPSGISSRQEPRCRRRSRTSATGSRSQQWRIHSAT